MVENSFHIQSVVLYVTAILVSAGLSKKLLRSGGGVWTFPDKMLCCSVSDGAGCRISFQFSRI